MAQSVPAKLPIDVSHPDKIFWPEEGYTSRSRRWLNLPNTFLLGQNRGRQHCAVEIEELSAWQSYPFGMDHDGVAPGRDGSVQAESVRSPGAGARLFVW